MESRSICLYLQKLDGHFAASLGSRMSRARMASTFGRWDRRILGISSRQQY